MILDLKVVLLRMFLKHVAKKTFSASQKTKLKVAYKADTDAG